MNFGMREKWRWLLRRCASPFQRIGNKLKVAAQRFVVKTIEKHSPVSSSSCAADGHLIALLKARRKSQDFHSPLRQVIPVKDLLLTSHPRVDFFYHRPLDLVETPWIVKGDYEPNVSAWILSNISRKDRVLIIGGGQGYHALTVAKQLEPTGQLLMIGQPSDDLEVVELNFRTNRLSASMTMMQSETLTVANREFRGVIRQFSPTIVLVDQGSHSVLDSIGTFDFCIQNVFVVDDGEVIRYCNEISSERTLPSWKVA